MFIKFHFIIFHLIEGKEKVQLKNINFDIVRVSLGETFWTVPTGGGHGVELWAAGTTDGGCWHNGWGSGYSRLTQLLPILLIAQPIVLLPNTVAVSVVLGFKNGCRGLILVIPFKKKNVCDYSLKL